MENREINEEQASIVEKKVEENKKTFFLMSGLIIIVAVSVFLWVNSNSDSNQKNSPTNISDSNTFSNALDSNSNSNIKESNSNINSNTFSNESESSSNSNIKESNSNINSNTNVKEVYLDLKKVPKYVPDETYLPSEEKISVGENADDYTEADVKIINKKAYIIYKDSKVEIRNINNVKQVIATSYSMDCESTINFIYLLTEEGKIYSYISDQLYPKNNMQQNEDAVGIVYPQNDKEIREYINGVSSSFVEEKLSKKYKSISLGSVPCGPSCGCGINKIGVAYDDEQYVINKNEMPFKEYYYFSYFDEGGYYVNLKGELHTGFWDKNEDKNLNIKPLYLFLKDAYISYVLTQDLDLYVMKNSELVKKSSKVKKIGVKNKTKYSADVTIYFVDGTKIESELEIIEF